VDILAGSTQPTNLKVLEFDAHERFEAFKSSHEGKFEEIARRGTFLDDGDIRSFVRLSMPGMDELFAALELTGWVRMYDRVIVDTAPTGHTLRLLSMPGVIQKWLEALDALLAKHRYMKEVFSGSYVPDELDQFLEELSESIDQMESLLRDGTRSRFIPVTLAEQLSVSETIRLINDLAEAGIRVNEIIVNRLLPRNECPLCGSGRRLQAEALNALKEEVKKCALWGVPLYPEEVQGSRLLRVFWNDICDIKPTKESLAGFESPLQSVQTRFAPMVEGSATLPGSQIALLLFAGKGGVGKTTLACATAIRLAREYSEREVLLFSTDPAHSLGDCLGIDVGPRFTSVLKGLTAMEFDAQEELNSLKTLHRREVRRFLQSMLKNFDLTFDREVMERLFDLAPPGLDEIMALTRVMEIKRKGQFDILVLDAAPTGHLIRLLEMPEIVDQWLKAFFELFLKYRGAFRLPELTERLVTMSRELKRLKSLLKDPDRSSLYAVSILTDMALNETQDLISSCDRMSVPVPLLFLNLATPPGDCELCSAINRRERAVKKKYEGCFPGKNQVLVYRQREIRGIGSLEQLGAALYENA
jgi:arsenite-transporting ATPase